MSNAVAWAMKGPDGMIHVYGLCDGTILSIDSESDLEMVWQLSTSPAQASEWLVGATAEMEEEGGILLGDPVEFDLPPTAVDEIVITRDHWTHAPMLREKLWAAVEGQIRGYMKQPWGRVIGHKNWADA